MALKPLQPGTRTGDLVVIVYGDHLPHRMRQMAPAQRYGKINLTFTQSVNVNVSRPPVGGCYEFSIDILDSMTSYTVHGVQEPRGWSREQRQTPNARRPVELYMPIPLAATHRMGTFIVAKQPLRSVGLIYGEELVAIINRSSLKEHLDVALTYVGVAARELPRIRRAMLRVAAAGARGKRW